MGGWVGGWMDRWIDGWMDIHGWATTEVPKAL